MTGKEILQRLREMEDEKNKYEDLWADISRYVNPRRELIRDSQRYDEKGKKRGRDVYDGTPNSALSIWADGMQGFMCAQSLRWFLSQMGDSRLNKVDEVRVWLQDYDEQMYSAYNRSNFYSVLSEWFRDAGSIGTATLYTEEDIGGRKCVHVPIHPREIFIAENLYGEVDTVFRKFQMTARQAVQRFDKSKLSDATVKNAEEHPEKMHEFVHAVFPNSKRDSSKLSSSGKKFKSVYLQVVAKALPENEDGHILKESGYSINPYAVWRFRKNSDEIYGYSPAADAIVEVFSLNQIGKSMLKAAQMSVEPPLNVPAEMRGHVRIAPNGYNYYEDPRKVITPINNAINFPIGIDREEKLRLLVEEKYRVEFFLTLARSTREMTATEIMERQSEKATLMGPQVDRLINEGLSKVFDIVSEIEDRAGRLPPPPQILLDIAQQDKVFGTDLGRIDIRFTGPLAQAQRRIFKMHPIKNGLAELAQAAILFPNITDRVNEEMLSEEILDSSDFPQSLMRSTEEVQKIRADRQAQIAQQQAQQMLMGAAEAYPKVIKKPEEGSPAEAIGVALG